MKTSDLFKDFVMDYSDNPEKVECIKQYETKYEIQDGTPIEDHPFYKDYLSRFDVDWEPVTPEVYDMTPQNWDLLVRLVLGSFSSKYDLSLDEQWKKNPIGRPRVNLCIGVTCKDSSITKTLDELWSFQIMRLFSIYINEQIDLVGLLDDENDDEDCEAAMLLEEREQRIKTYRKKMENLMAEAKSCQERVNLFPWLNDA